MRTGLRPIDDQAHGDRRRVRGPVFSRSLATGSVTAPSWRAIALRWSRPVSGSSIPGSGPSRQDQPESARHGPAHTAQELEGHDRKGLAEAGRRQEAPRVPGLPLRPGRGRQPAHGHLFRRSRRGRADGARRADLHQERRRPDAGLPPLLPRGGVRVLRDEHRRHQHARLHALDGRCRRPGDDLSPAATCR